MGKDARGGAGVNDMRWGKTPAARALMTGEGEDARGAGVIDLARGMTSPQMLELVSLNGTTVTIDAMGTQTEIASIIS